MHCLKCGREVEEGQSFCPECLAVLRRHPVAQDTVLVLPPKRNAASRRFAGKKRALSNEEKLAETRQQLFQSRVLCVILSVLVLVFLGLSVFLLLRPSKPAVGRNYQTPSSATTASSLPVS